MAGSDAVIHLANLYEFWVPDKSAYHAVNIEGTRNVMEEALAAGVSKVVHISSQVIYGKPEDDPFTEESTPAPRYSLYAEKVPRRPGGLGAPHKRYPGQASIETQTGAGKMSKALIARFSQTGTTDRVAERIAAGLRSAGWEVDLWEIAQDGTPDLAGYELGHRHTDLLFPSALCDH